MNGLKEKAGETILDVFGKMIGDNATIAFLLLVLVFLLGFYLYVNHNLQQQVIEMRLMEYERETERFMLIDSMTQSIDEVRVGIRDMLKQESRYMDILREIRKSTCKE